MSDLDKQNVVKQNIEIMNKLQGFNVIIVCCGTPMLAAYWQQRLDAGKGSIVPATSTVLAVDEDWKGGAGNALGTLYAFQKAAKLALERSGINLYEELKSGKISAGMYHTAGKGTRLAPLPGAENNNKPGVKLPVCISIGGKESPLTILEAVIKQTGVYSLSRPGRLSVFWGDQVFVPTISVEYTVKNHVDILCTLGPMPTAQQWEEMGLHKYGLIANNKSGLTAQVEKVDHATAVDLLSNLGEIESVGASLGSFSVSWQFLGALNEEFATELTKKEGKYDSDPHLWMPITLEKPAYLKLMAQKGSAAEESGPHYDRIRVMMTRFLASADHKATTYGVFGPTDVGQAVPWWDYGLLKLYQRNTLLVTENTPEADMMRLFLGVPEYSANGVVNSVVSSVNVDPASRLFGCNLGDGTIKKSVLINVNCNYIEAEGCVLMNVTADRIIAKRGSIIYNVVDEGTLLGDGTGVPKDGSVLVGVFDSAGKQSLMASHLDIDGGKVWDMKLPENTYSFSEIYSLNATTDPTSLELLISSSHKETWSSISSN